MFRVHIWGEHFAAIMLILHLLSGVLLLGTITHQSWLIFRGTAWKRGRVVVRYAKWTVLSYLVCFVLGALVYVPFRYYVRYEFLDTTIPWATCLFEIKEHILAVGCVLLPHYLWSARHITELNRAGRMTHALNTVTLLTITWFSFIVGAILTNFKGV